MTVRLVSSRKFLFCFAWAEPEKHVRTTLTEDMLQLPIYSGRGCDIEVSPSYRDAIRAALQGLMILEDFDAVVSIEYFRFRKCLIVDDYTWGEISIKHQPTEIVASFKNYDPTVDQGLKEKDLSCPLCSGYKTQGRTLKIESSSLRSNKSGTLRTNGVNFI
ncbi:hypothetical protein KC865_03000 [Candidatus Kaiserbacteria bacterium]|nr:hypothetical protein [Candidatus Kaiserbacteria bacterium]